MLHRITKIKRRRLLPTVNEMMAAHKNAVVIANIRQKNQPLVVPTPGGRLIIFDTETREAAEARHNKRGWALTGYGAPAVSIARLGSRASRPPPRAHRLSLHLFSILFIPLILVPPKN